VRRRKVAIILAFLGCESDRSPAETRMKLQTENQAGQGVSARGSVWILCLAMALWPELASGKKDPRADDLKHWVDGPVHYIARKEEMKAFRGLKTVEERALFVERFWARRDPNPETLTNPRRQRFWERVAEANSNFLDSPRPGWMTDRGKIHVLYGPPTEIQEELNLRLETPGTHDGVGILRWIYEGRPGERADMNAIVVVPFTRDGSGEWKISTEPRLASVFFDAHQIADPIRGRFERFLTSMNSSSRSPLSVMLDLGKMQEVPPQEQVILERVETAEAYQTHPIPITVERYLLPDESTIVVSVTAGLGETSSQAEPAVIARLEPDDPHLTSRLLGEDSFVQSGEGDRRLSQARIKLPAGEYTLTVMVADPVRVSTGMHRGRLVIPELPKTMRFSDITLAETMESLKFASLASHIEPFHVGPFRVTPKLDRIVRQGESVRLFFEVYNAVPPIQVSYQLEGQENDGSWVPLGKPSVTAVDTISQAWELPTTLRWPVGEYRVRVDAQDSDGRLISTHAAFTLQAPEAS